MEQNRHNTVEISAFDILSHLFEIETGQIYQMKTRHQVFSGIREEDGVEKNENKLTKFSPQDAYNRAEQIIKSLSNVKIIPLSGKLDDVFKKSKYRHRMDHVYLSSHISGCLSESLLTVSPCEY